MNKRRSNRSLNLILGEKTLKQIQKSRILLVGAGGIGCQVIKNLTKVSLSHISIIDFDTIEQTNLNRQFYFRKEHIGLFKAQVIKEQIQKIVPSLEVNAFTDDLYSKRFNDKFYLQFDLIISALDSIKVRQYLAVQATRNGKPLVDAGTMSYNGQAYASIRFKTTCHNCQPSRVDIDTGAACLIRSRPEKYIHCATFAKNFYESFFTLKGETMSDRLKHQNFINKNLTLKDIQSFESIGKQLFTELFDQGINNIDSEGNKLDSSRKIQFEDALTLADPLKNPPSTFNEKQFQRQSVSIYEEDKVWSIKQYTECFLTSFTKLLKRKLLNTLPFQFEKDDEDIMLFVYCVASLRVFNFINWTSPSNKLSFLTYYQCKDLIGKVMPAIASTNAIAAALEIRQTINILSSQFDKLRVIHFSNISSERLSPCFQSSSLLSCNVCSQKIIYAKVELDIQKVTFKVFQDFASQQLFSFNRDLFSDSYVLIRNSKKTISPNKNKPISFVREMFHDGVLPVTFRGGNTPIVVHISLFDTPGKEGINIIQSPSKKDFKLQLLKFYRKVHQNDTFLMSSDLKFYGGHEI